MTDIAARYRNAAEGLRRRVAAVPEGEWSRPSPCEGWTALDVLRHVLDTHRGMPARAGIELDPWPDPADNALAAWDAASGQVAKLLADPAEAGREYDSMFGRTTIGAVIDQFITFDVVVHTWDIARACGLDERLDEHEVASGLAMAREMGDKMRVPGGMGPEVPVADDADDQTKWLGLLGRRA